MKEQLIEFETAKLAKEKGFDWESNAFYSTRLSEIPQFETDKSYQDYNNEDFFVKEIVSAPTQSLLQKWLRDVHDIYTSGLPFRDIESNVEFSFYYTLVENNEELEDILCNEHHLGASNENYKTHEQALEAGLLEALKLIDNERKKI